MRYQQKQKQELDQKRTELLGSRGLAPLGSPTENGKILIGNGKVRPSSLSRISVFHSSAYIWISIASHFQVRQMFDERRQRVAGIDKSYPLQPITTRPMPNVVSRPVKATTVMKFRFALVGVAKFNRRCENMKTPMFVFLLWIAYLRWTLACITQSESDPFTCVH